MMVGKYRLKELLHGRIDKKTGKTVILGCLEKKKRQDDTVGKVVCKICGLCGIQLKRHMNDIHKKRGVSTSQEGKATMRSGCGSKQEMKDQKSQSQSVRRISYTRAEFDQACEATNPHCRLQHNHQEHLGILHQSLGCFRR